MSFKIGDILSVSLVGHTCHFFVYIGDDLTVGWGSKNKNHFLDNIGQVEYKSFIMFIILIIGLVVSNYM